ncbi:MAG: VCBS repeat-containing protein, partial [Planctomycetaceae bacterium]
MRAVVTGSVLVWTVVTGPLLAILCHQSSAGAAEFPTFKHTVVDARIGNVCYAVTVADVDGDQRLDIVAVSENRVVWYQSPSWKAHVIIQDQTPRDNVCIAPWDIDGDGKVDFALGAGWTKTGTIHWLSRGDSLDQPWRVHAIGEERWLHRMRWADVLGKGRPQLVISPLNATVGSGVRLTALEIPDDPRQQRWVPTVLNQQLNRMHNHWHVD